MSFNYSGDPANSDLDAVRHLIGDVSSDGNDLEDEEITYNLNNTPSVIEAAINSIENIIARIADKPDAVEAESVSADYSSKINKYIKLKNQLEERQAEDDVGQLNNTDVITAQDKDNVFSLGQFDNTSRF